MSFHSQHRKQTFVLIIKIENVIGRDDEFTKVKGGERMPRNPV